MRERKPIIKKTTQKAVAPRFNVPTLQSIADDIAKGKYGDPVPGGRVVVSDEMQMGLKANVFKEYWSYLVEYKVKGRPGRPHLTIGKHPVMSIAEARELAKVIRHLGSIGIDVQEGLIDRLVVELKRDGIQWRGGLAPKP